jgi:hypothetical protein
VGIQDASYTEFSSDIQVLFNSEIVMVSITSLWLPIFLSAIAVFLASSVLHMVLSYHRSDFKKVPGEDEIMDTLRRIGVPSGDYVFPHAADSSEMKDPAFQEKTQKGPVAMLTVMESGFAMGRSLVEWFVYCVAMGVFAAYITGRALDAGAPYMEVFRFAGAAAFGGYALALLQNSIWYKRAWGATLKSVADGVIYALLTAGIFGWLWPG